MAYDEFIEGWYDSPDSRDSVGSQPSSLLLSLRASLAVSGIFTSMRATTASTRSPSAFLCSMSFASLPICSYQDEILSISGQEISTFLKKLPSDIDCDQLSNIVFGSSASLFCRSRISR